MIRNLELYRKVKDKKANQAKFEKNTGIKV